MKRHQSYPSTIARIFNGRKMIRHRKGTRFLRVRQGFKRIANGEPLSNPYHHECTRYHRVTTDNH